MLVVAPILEDIDETVELEAFHAETRNETMRERLHHRIIEALVWLTCELRKWVLPMMVLGATLGLLMRESLTSGNLLLDGIAVAFVTTLDDTLAWVFFRYSPSQEAKEPMPWEIWLFHRLFAACLVASVMVTVLQAVHLLSHYGNERKYGAVCSDIREIVTVAPSYVCIFFAVFNAPLRLWMDKGKKSTALRITVRFLVNLIFPTFLVYRVRSSFVNQGPLVMLQMA